MINDVPKRPTGRWFDYLFWRVIGTLWRVSVTFVINGLTFPQTGTLYIPKGLSITLFTPLRIICFRLLWHPHAHCPLLNGNTNDTSNITIYEFKTYALTHTESVCLSISLSLVCVRVPVCLCARTRSIVSVVTVSGPAHYLYGCFVFCQFNEGTL